MLHLYLRAPRLCFLRSPRRHHFHHHHHHHRFLSSSSSSSSSSEPPTDLDNPEQLLPPPPPILRQPTTLSPRPPPSLSRNSVIAVSAATAVSALVAAVALLSSSDHDQKSDRGTSSNPLYAGVEQAIQKSGESFKKVFHHVKQTGVAASVLWQSLSSVLSSANHEVRSGFGLRVAALLADIAAANESRRAAIVGAGGGAVVDWLLESVAVQRDGNGTQAESARALAYLIADPNVSAAVLGRPGAVPKLLRFIFSCQPRRSKKHSRRSSLDISDSLKGRSMLVAAIMDVVTSNCDSLENLAFKPSLPGNAETRDIAAVIEVIEEGGMHLEESLGGKDDGDGGGGIKGIGIKVLGGTTVLGFSRTTELMELRSSSPRNVESDEIYTKGRVLQNKRDNSLAHTKLASAVVPGLWDDLHCEHVAVPFAAWALANWAMASDVNRSLIQEMDQDGKAVMTALTAPERSVKWHGSLVAKLLLADENIPLNDYVSDWCSSLLSTVSQASKNDDIPLAQVALSAFLVSVERSPRAQKTVMEKGLHLMRETAKRTTKHKHVQEALAKALELMCSADLHFSLEESQKWSGILLSWVFGKHSSDNLHSSAIKILSSILEDHGPFSIPISQGWLAILLSEVLASSKAASVKGNVQPKADKVKTQIDQSNILSAGQVVNQLSGSVVNLAGSQLGTATDSNDAFPYANLLSMEPFVGPSKNLKKDSVPKFDVADSAMATLKGIKALAELSYDDSSCRDKITDCGVLCLLRRLLLCDDFEKLAAIKAYDASKILEAQEKNANVPSESSETDNNDQSSVRVPPTAHIRRHAARLLTILSLLPKVQKVILADENWCTWLESCANGKIPGCSDLKIQSYARATLLNIFCNQESEGDSVNDDIPNSGAANKRKTCPHYNDIIFLINPQLPHWKCPEKCDQDNFQKEESSLAETIAVDHEDEPVTRPSNDDNLFGSDASQSSLGMSETPLFDVVFVHGLRGGPYKTWRIAEDKSSTKSGLVEKIDQEAGKLGTFWPGEWLSADFPQARMFTLKYKTNLTQWSGASLPLQEVSSMLLEKLVDAGIGDRPVVFVTHSMGGLVVKQMLYKAKTENVDNLVKNTIGVVFYSCPHFGSKLADMPWRMGLVLRPAPSIGELRSGSTRLIELNDFTRQLHKKGLLDVLSFCEVLESTDHINSCKPLSRADPSYTETLEFLRKLKANT
ncbi:uncharacterized protein LOC21408749 isoform X2 [Morus notabilis]|uniref:uncharacterized protein LOC21408749 isoform X2 n=1 Tax=Morus notabilis TaxID=981085 RepID=UPI000CED70AE|nr:uncharacterized protein LOC21408749 isoform X2 [Morus notabilis]